MEILKKRATRERPVLPPLIWKPSPNHHKTKRSVSAIKKVVVHVTVGSYASGVNWMANPKSEVASHFCLREDGLQATQLVAYEYAAWTQAEANEFCVSIEMAGYPDKQSPEQLAVCARMVAYLCHRFDLPARYSPEWETPCFCRHGDLGASGGNHPSCPMTVDHFTKNFVPLVQREADRAGFLPSWGR